MALGAKDIDPEKTNPYRKGSEKGRKFTPEQLARARKARMKDYVASMKAMNQQRKKSHGNGRQ